MQLFPIYSFAGLVCHFGIDATEIGDNAVVVDASTVQVSSSWAAFSEAMATIEKDCTIQHDPACVRDVVAVLASRPKTNTSGTPGLGDIVAAGLSAIGITKERVSSLVGGDCGCRDRQAAWNAAGAKYLGLPPGSTAVPEIDPDP